MKVSQMSESKSVNRPDSKPDAFRDLVLPDGTIVRGKRTRDAWRDVILPNGTIARGKRLEVKP
jgi:hypothetical protein